MKTKSKPTPKSTRRFAAVLTLLCLGSLPAIGNENTQGHTVATQEAPVPTPAPAGAVLPVGAKSATKLELDAIRTQNALAAERMKSVPGGGGGASGLAVPAPAQSIPVAPAGGVSGGASPSSVVTMVAGPVGQLSATIQTPRGLTVVRAGDHVPNLGTIESISVDEVLVKNGKRRLSLPFAAEPASSLIQGRSAPVPMGPPFGGM